MDTIWHFLKSIGQEHIPLIFLWYYFALFGIIWLFHLMTITNWLIESINQLIGYGLMAHGSRLMAEGASLALGLGGTLGPGPYLGGRLGPGRPRLAMSHEPWAMKLETWPMHHSWSINQSIDYELID